MNVPRGALGLLRERNYRLLFTATTASFVGESFQHVALASLVLDLTSSPSELARVFMLAMAPRVLLMPLGGLLSDRFGPKTAMVPADLTRALLVGGLAALVLSGRCTIVHLYAYALVSGAVSAFFYPAASAILPEMVDASALMPANALLEVSGSIVAALIPPAVGALVQARGPSLAFASCAAMLVVSASTIALIQHRRAAPAAASSFVGDLREAVLALRADAILVVGIALAAAAALGSSVAAAGVPSLAKLELHAGDVGVGLLIGALGVGAFFGGLAALVGPQPRRVAVVACVAIGVHGLALAIASQSTTFGTAAFGCACVGALAIYGRANIMTLVQQRSSPEVRGRVLSFLLLGYRAAFLAAFVCVAALGDTVGIRRLLVAGGVLIVIVSVAALARAATGDSRH